MNKKISLALVSVALGAVALAGCSTENSPSANADPDCTPVHEFETVESGKLTVAVPVSPPYSIKEGAAYNGLDNQILAKIAEMECLTIVQQEMTFPAGLQSVQSGRVDTSAGGVAKTEEREAAMHLSVTTYRDGMAVVSEEGFNTIEEIKPLTVGTVQGYFWNEDLIAALGNDRVKQYQATDALYADLGSGRIDAAFVSTPEAGYRETQFPDSGLQIELMEPTELIAGSMGFGDVSIPVAKDAGDLAAAIDADVQTLIDNGTIAEILEGYKIDTKLAGPSAK